MSNLQSGKEFFALNSLRFVAALWVLIFHCNIHFGQIELLAYIQPVIDQGALAMTLFFMLSGFVLSYRYKGFSTLEELKSYSSARLARLYPVYAIMGLTTLWKIPEGANSFELYANQGYTGQIFFMAVICLFFMLMLQAWFPAFFTANIWNFGGSWSLSVEAFFYSTFPWMRNRTSEMSVQKLAIMLGLMVLTMAVIAIGMQASHLKGQDGSCVFYVVPIFRLPEFIIGVVGFVLFVERGVGIQKLYINGAISGVLLIVLIYKWNSYIFINYGLINYAWLAAIPFLAVFVLSIKIDAPIPIKAFFNYSGRISYCVYMAQFTTIPIIKKFRAELSLNEAWILCILTTLFLAVLIYHLVEVPFYLRTRQFALYMLR